MFMICILIWLAVGVGKELTGNNGF